MQGSPGSVRLGRQLGVVWPQAARRASHLDVVLGLAFSDACVSRVQVGSLPGRGSSGGVRECRYGGRVEKVVRGVPARIRCLDLTLEKSIRYISMPMIRM